MAKQILTTTHIAALEAFKITVADHAPAVENAKGVSVHIESGRKFDRVMVRYIMADGTEGDQSVWYFVDRKDGTIYGRKTDISPNLRWYFGTIFTTVEWLWQGNYASPKKPEQFEKLDKYGELARYLPRVVAVGAVA